MLWFWNQASIEDGLGSFQVWLAGASAEAAYRSNLARRATARVVTEAKTWVWGELKAKEKDF